MGNHENRAHALLSASSAHRWIMCPPSARLEEQFPDTTSEAAKEGTLAHEICELKLQHYFNTTEMTRKKFSTRFNKLKKHELYQPEMDGHTETYLEYVKSLALSFPSSPRVDIEKRLDLSNYVKEGFGTGDCILIHDDTLHVIDFKYGKGVPVSAELNPQMLLYALGAYDMCHLFYNIQNIVMHIVQPRLSDEASTWTCDITYLRNFGTLIKEKAEIAFRGEGEFYPDPDACRFCRAKNTCRARSDYNVKQAFNIGEMPPLITNEEVGERLKKLADVVKYQKDLQDYALSECLAGREVSGWKAVEGRGSRDWTDMDAAFDKLQKNGIAEAVLWERKPLTLAQTEKVVGKKEFTELVGDMVIMNPGKPTLAKAEDKREAITNIITAEEAFKEEE